MTYAQGPGTIVALTSGLQYVPQGTAVTQAYVNAAITAGFTGLYFDPRYVYTVSALSLNGVNNFTFESRMYGYLRANGPVGYLNFTNTTGDCIAVYNSNSIRFNGLAVVATTTGSVLHFGGGVHDSGGRDCYFRNLSNSAGGGITTAAFCWIADTQLQDAANEDNGWADTYFDGAYCAVGVGINDQAHQANDTRMDNCRIAGGPYGVYHLEGGGWTWINLYDRISSSIANFYVSSTNAGNIALIGGEPWNSTSGTGYCLQVLGGYVTLEGELLITNGGGGQGVAIGGGFVNFNSGRIAAPSTPLVMTGGVANFGPSFQAVNFTASGSVGTIYLQGPAGILTPYSPPNVSGFSGTVRYVAYPATVFSAKAAGATTTQTLAYTPPSVAGIYRAFVSVRVTVAGTSTIPTLTFKNDGGGTTGPTAVSMIVLGGTVLLASLVANGSYSGNVQFSIDASGTPIQVVITPTGSTFSYTVTIEQMA